MLIIEYVLSKFHAGHALKVHRGGLGLGMANRLLIFFKLERFFIRSPESMRRIFDEALGLLKAAKGRAYLHAEHIEEQTIRLQRNNGMETKRCLRR